MVRGTVDFATTIGTLEKYRHLTFSHSVFDTQMVYVSNPRKPVTKYTNVLDPFTGYVWGCLVLMLIFVMIFFTAMQGIFRHLYANRNGKSQ